MKKIFFLSVALLTLFISCNNSSEKKNSDQAMADTLLKEVMDGHDVGMARMHKLDKAQKQAQQILDSIAKLPAAAQQAAASLKTQMDELLKDLGYADFAMNKWMNEFNYDSAKSDIQQRIKYLADEKLKVDKMKEAILSSLSKADSLLESKN